jgi:hypothetical protein
VSEALFAGLPDMTRSRWLLLGLMLLAIAVFFSLSVGSASIDETNVTAATATTNTPATPTETTNPTVPASPLATGVLWVGDVETGDVSQWRSVSISGKADVEVVTSPVHGGDFALKLINWDVDGSHNAGVRMNLQGPFGEDPNNLPTDGYYSAWYFIPFAFEGHSNIFQFKQSDATRWDSNGNPTSATRRMLWKAGLYWSGDGTYDLEFRTRIDQGTGEWRSTSQRLGIADVNIPVGEWFHLETRYLWGQNGTGRTTVWLNGTQVWDRAGSTEASNLECLHRCREWVNSHYLSDYQGYVAPGDSWIYVDDARLSTTRIGAS